MSARAPEPDRVCPQSRDALLFAVAPVRLVAVACCGALCICPAHANAEEATVAGPESAELAVVAPSARAPGGAEEPPAPRVDQDRPEPARDAPASAAPPPPKTEPTSAPLPPPAADAADIPPTSYWTTKRIAGWSLLGAAAASTGLAIYFDSERREAREAHEELLSATDPSADAGDESAKLEEEYQQARTGTVVASVTAVVSGVFGAFFLLNNYDSAAPPSTMAQVSVDPTGARIDFSGRF